MNGLQMVAVLLLLALLTQAYSVAMGFDTTYLEVLAGLALLKGVALFLVPEKAPIVLMKARPKEEEQE